MLLLKYCLYFFAFLFLINIAVQIIDSACDLIKIKIGVGNAK